MKNSYPDLDTCSRCGKLLIVGNANVMCVDCRGNYDADYEWYDDQFEEPEPERDPLQDIADLVEKACEGE